jgi:hypothetical protein
MASLEKVEQSELEGATGLGATPGGAWLSLAQDSKTLLRALEGALKLHPWVSKMLLQNSRPLGLAGSHALRQNALPPLKLMGI